MTKNETLTTLVAKVSHFAQFGLFLLSVVSGLVAFDRVILFLGF